MYSPEVARYMRGLNGQILELAEELYLKIQLLRIATIFPALAGITTAVSFFAMSFMLLGWPAASKFGIAVFIFAFAIWAGFLAWGLVKFSRWFEDAYIGHLKDISEMLFKHPEILPVAKELARIDSSFSEYIREVGNLP